MKLLGNIIWMIFGGLIQAFAFFFVGLILCITVIGMPLGLQFFKYAKLMLCPFGQEVDINVEKHMILNVLWVVCVGFAMASSFLVLGVLFCFTIIGIPFGLQWFKLAKLAAFPFGATIK